MGIWTLNFLKAIKASWFVSSLFCPLSILAIFECFRFYFFTYILSLLSLQQTEQAHRTCIHLLCSMINLMWTKTCLKETSKKSMILPVTTTEIYGRSWWWSHFSQIFSTRWILLIMLEKLMKPKELVAKPNVVYEK